VRRESELGLNTRPDSEEHWQGGEGSEGKSLTFFDPAAKRWHQTWIDNTAQPL
jgi:hypothetical protein